MAMTEQQAREAIMAYIQQAGTQSAVAQQLGISAGALSQYVKGSYAAPHTITPKIEALLATREAVELAPTEPGYTDTSVSKMVIDTITYCHLQGKIGVVYGDAGVGKTMGVQEYLRRNPLAIGITICPAYASMSGVNELLAEALGIRERTSRRIYAEIVSRLRGSGRVIIIDEAQHLTKKTLDHVRSISDGSGVGVCLVGNEEVYSRLKGTGKADFAQLFSRIWMRRMVLTRHITQADIAKVFFDAHLEPNAVEFLYKIARTGYGLRGAVNVFVNTVAAFQQVTAEGVVRMAREMNIHNN